MWHRDQYPQSLQDAMALHSFFNTIGYSLENEVFLGLIGEDVIVELRAEGREGPFRIGKAEHEQPVMQEKWLAFLEEWNTGGTMTTEEKDEMCRTSAISRMKPFVLIALDRYGFTRWKMRPSSTVH